MFLASLEWRVARQGCLVPLRKGGMWQSSRPASLSPAGLILWPNWLEHWPVTLSMLSTQVRIPVGLSVLGRYNFISHHTHSSSYCNTPTIFKSGEYGLRIEWELTFNFAWVRLIWSFRLPQRWVGFGIHEQRSPVKFWSGTPLAHCHFVKEYTAWVVDNRKENHKNDHIYVQPLMEAFCCIFWNWEVRFTALHLKTLFCNITAINMHNVYSKYISFDLPILIIEISHVSCITNWLSRFIKI